MNDPDGHLFIIRKSKNNKDDITKVTLNVKNLAKSKEFWISHLKMYENYSDSETSILSYAQNQVKIDISIKKVHLHTLKLFIDLCIE